MNEIPQPATSPEELFANAVDALTALVSYVHPADLDRGWPARRVDRAEAIVQVLMAVTANMGTLDGLLSGRPGSWEADRVRQLVESACEDPYNELTMAQRRTTRILVDPDTEGRFYDEGIDEACDRAGEELAAPIDALEAQIVDAGCNKAQAGEIAKLTTVIQQLSDARWNCPNPKEAPEVRDSDGAAWVQACEAHHALWLEALARGRTARPDLAAELDAAQASYEALDALHEGDKRAYEAAFLAAARAVAAEHHITAEIRLREPGAPGDPMAWDGVEEFLTDAVRERTPLPDRDYLKRVPATNPSPMEDRSD